MGQTNRLKRERQKRNRKLNRQKKDANVRAKYGPRRKPNPVVVKSVETGEVIDVLDQSSFNAGFADSLERKARAAGYAGYAAYLHSAHWRRMRARMLARDGCRCRRCKSDRGLSVHHRYYAELGAERLGSLETLCGDCHRKIHAGV